MLTSLKERPELALACAILAYLLLTIAFAPDVFFPSVVLIAVCIAQNTAFSLVSRSRNRSNKAYHAIAAVFSNGVWFATMAYMITELNFEFWIIVPYILGTVTGSLVGADLSMRIEAFLDIGSDDHLKRVRTLNDDDLKEIYLEINGVNKALSRKIEVLQTELITKNQNGLVGRDNKGRFKKVSQ